MKPTAILISLLCVFAALPDIARGACADCPKVPQARGSDSFESSVSKSARKAGVESELPVAIARVMRDKRFSKFAKGRLGPMGINPAFARQRKMSAKKLRGASANAGASVYFLKGIIGKRKGGKKSSSHLSQADVRYVLRGYILGPSGSGKLSKMDNMFMNAVMKERSSLVAERSHAPAIKKQLAKSEKSSSAAGENRDKRVDRVLDANVWGGKGESLGCPQTGGMGGVSGGMGGIKSGGGGSSSGSSGGGTSRPGAGVGGSSGEGSSGGGGGTSPGQYDEIIKKYAEKFKLNPKLVKALIKQESGFNATVVSKDGHGSVGLTQPLPATAKQMAKKLGMNDVANLSDQQIQEKLKDPDFNILIGCAYLDYLREEGAKDDFSMLSGYNGGPGRIRNPIPATTAYARKVMAMMPNMNI
ncbi:MAG: lytic transglycosylase domain-containing protein [Elusimicrobiales bacterium]|nr:lytic transglycosylase domain-containing protein [Elusimicrobiales bacterium]